MQQFIILVQTLGRLMNIYLKELKLQKSILKIIKNEHKDVYLFIMMSRKQSNYSRLRMELLYLRSSSLCIYSTKLHGNRVVIPIFRTLQHGWLKYMIMSRILY